MTPDQLKEFRKRYKWSQRELAARLGCSLRSIVNWEKGTHPVPEYIDLAVSAVAMNLPPYGK